MELTTVPEHLLILGGNYLGLEFGQMFRRFNSQFTVVELLEQLIPREDEDVAEEPWTLLEKAMYIHPTLAEGLFTLMEGVKAV